MKRLWVIVFCSVAGLVSGESPLYWALTNNDAGEVWHLAAEPLPGELPENDLNPVAWAVSRGNAEAVSALRWRGVPLDGVDAQGRNLLFAAAALGRVDLFETLVASGVQPLQVDRGGETLVHQAAASPHPELLKVLLARGMGPKDKTASGVTPLMRACAAGRADEAAVLLAWGAVPEDVDYLGRSVRDYAQASGDEATLTLIDGALAPWTIEPGDEAPPP